MAKKIEWDKQELIALATIIGAVSTFAEKLAPLDVACSAIIDAVMELQRGELSDSAIERLTKAIEAAGGFDPDGFQTSMARAVAILEPGLKARGLV